MVQVGHAARIVSTTPRRCHELLSRLRHARERRISVLPRVRDRPPAAGEPRPAPRRDARRLPRARRRLARRRTREGASRTASGDRFVPGTILADRYRIVGLLGRGGMGEVYRADDLKLEQPVALKFLPPALEADRDRVERLYAEVRTARQVSHPAVCRVWDIGEAEGQHFLSMEFVDGENLASLLRRIGRFPLDKALDVARQIAEGLGAAHAKGLLHRDLKPANVMLDGRGQVRLTDFGLAGLADTLSGEDVRSGTPAYMSPEQLLGREVSVRSDIYSLGLVVYELVTGRRAFEGKGFAELARKHRDERPIEPSALVRGLDPGVERTILACLEKEPRKRPPSALAAAAMLSGRDPLEAAIAAGETPSPELVAAAGDTEGLRPRTGWWCLSFVAVGVLLLPALMGPRQLMARIPVEKSPASLEDRGARAPRALRAREARRLGGGPQHRHRLPPLDRGARPLRDALELARHRRAAGAGVLVSAGSAAARTAEPGGARRLERSAAARRRDGRRELRPAGPAGLVPRRAAAARAGEAERLGRGRRRRARLGAALRRGAARAFGLPASRAALDAALLRRDARRLGGALAGAPGPAAAHRGGELPRSARLVRDQERLDAGRARAGFSADPGPAPDADLLDPAAGGARRRGLRARLSKHLARPRRPPGRLPAGARARDAHDRRLGSARAPRRRPRGRAHLRGARNGLRRAGGGERLALLPGARALRAAPAALDARLVDAPPERRLARRRRGPRPAGGGGGRHRPRVRACALAVARPRCSAAPSTPPTSTASTRSSRRRGC